MSLSLLLTGLAEFVGDVLVNDCGRPEPDRVLRYHGTLPHDCCTEDGFLVVNWVQEYQSDNFPSAVGGAASPCQGSPVVELRVRYVVCWPDAPEHGINDAYDTEVDGLAAMLADVADCVFRALLRLTCAQLDASDPFVAGLLDEVAGGRVRVVSATPIMPLGMCAGVEWRLYAAPLAGVPAS